MKKLLVPAFVVCLLLGLGTTSLASFTDQPKPTHWVYDSFTTLYNSGLLQGYPDGEFKGCEKATRYEMVILTARVLEVMEEKLETVLYEKKYLSEDEVKNLITDAVNNMVTVDDVYEALKNLESEFKDELAKFDTKVTTIEDKMSSLEVELNLLKKANEARNQEIATLKMALDVQKKELEALKNLPPVKDPDIEKAAKDAKTAKVLGIAGVTAGLAGLLVSLFY